MDQLIEVARFQTRWEADTLCSLLESEGVPYFLRDEIMSQTYGSIGAFGGIKLDIPEENVPLAIEIIKKGGYEKYLNTDEYPEELEDLSSFSKKIPFLRKYPLEKQIVIILLAAAIAFALLVFSTYYL